MRDRDGRSICQEAIHLLFATRGRVPPLRNVVVRHDPVGGGAWITLSFHEGEAFSWIVPVDGVWQDGFPDSVRDATCSEIVDLYNRLAEDEFIQRNVREARRRLDMLAADSATDRAYLADLSRRIEEAERHAREFHAVNATSPGRSAAVDLGARDDLTAYVVHSRRMGRRRALEQIELAATPLDLTAREAQRMRERLERELFSTMTLGEAVFRGAATTGTATTVDAAGPAITVESVRRAMEELARSDYRRRFDEVPAAAFLQGLWSTLADDVGTSEAQDKGERLLRDWLTPEQRAQYDKDKAFEVRGGETGKRYRINYGRQQNIHEVDDAGNVVCGWCFLPQGQLVAGDVMLAQKIALETNERAALKVANRF